MKIQARIGAFETNSSTNHTLCIVRPGTEKRLDDAFCETPHMVNFPCFTGEEASKKLDELKYTIDGNNLGDLSLDAKVTLVISASLDRRATDFIEKVELVHDILESKGIDMHINWNDLKQMCQLYYWDDGISSVLDEMNRDAIEAFLFSCDTMYASWCDEGCCPPPKEYSDLIDRIELLSKDRPDDIIVLNDRC